MPHKAARGVRDHALAYYNAQIWAAARLNQVPLVFSEDFQDSLALGGYALSTRLRRGLMWRSGRKAAREPVLPKVLAAGELQ